jgi:hypothetical protein
VSLITSPVDGQGPTAFKTRLSPVPVDATTQPKTTGVGTVTATLQGTTLSVTGTFSGLQGPATVARLHVAPRGVRGPAAMDLTVTPATSGAVQGTVTLTAVQVDHLRRTRLYVQLHSEAAPDGNLWGWLIPEITR